jgi:peptidoglycan/LPS O-acetylase OafA/YrhL
VSAEPSRLSGLDLLRAFAIIWVMLFHGLTLGLGTPWLQASRFGWMGVNLFFVLSGFLIGSQWLRENLDGSRPFARFYTRRALRILPPYLVTVAAYVWVPNLRETPEIVPTWQFLSFTENLFVDIHHSKAFSHVWSLCVEEHFYLLFPPIAWLLLSRSSARTTVAVITCVLLGGMALRGGLWFGGVAGLPLDDSLGNLGQRYQELIYYPTWTNLDGLLAGIALATVRIHRPLWWVAATVHSNTLVAAGLAVLAVSVWLFWDPLQAAPAIVGYPVLSLAWALIVAGGISREGLLGRLRIPGAALIANLAYSLYLTHKMAFHAIETAGGAWLGQHGAVAFFVYGAAAGSVAGLMHVCVERPILRLRDRLPGVRVQPNAVPRPLRCGEKKRERICC